MKEYLSKIPIPMAGVALGITVLGNLLKPFSPYLRIMCGIIAAILVTLVLLKFIFCFKQVREDFKNPIIVSVSPTIYMALMNLSVYALDLNIPYIYQICSTIWYISVIMHILAIIYVTYFMLKELELRHVYPTFFVTYVGIVVASITASNYNADVLGNLIFWFGLGAYLIVFVLITMRYFKHEVEEGSKPLFAIYAAPMSVSLMGYISVYDVPNVYMMLTMSLLAQIFYFIVVSQIPKIIKLPFYPSYAALTFPMCITPFAFFKVIERLEGTFNYHVSEILKSVYFIEVVIAVLIVGYVLYYYLKLLYNNFIQIKKGS